MSWKRPLYCFQFSDQGFTGSESRYRYLAESGSMITLNSDPIRIRIKAKVLKKILIKNRHKCLLKPLKPTYRLLDLKIALQT
jgi:hypothetical protein